MTSLMRALRPLLRPDSNIINSISRRLLTKDVAPCDTTDFGLNAATYYSYHYPPTKGGQLDVNFMIRRITHWLHCSPNEAKNVLSRTPSLRHCHLNSVNNYINFMKDKCIDMKLVVRNPWLLDYSLSTMRERMTMLLMVGISQETIHLLKLKTNDIVKVVQRWISDERSGKYNQNGNRLEFFSKHLNCTVEQLTILMKESCHLLTSDLDEVMGIYFMLLNHEIAPSDILNNLDIFRYSLTDVRGKLEEACLANAKIKIWMLKAQTRKLCKNSGKEPKYKVP